MLDLAILGLLEDQPLHGYELKKRLGETLGSSRGISWGSVYPALRRLDREGAIEVLTPGITTGAPTTGSLTGDLAVARSRRIVKGATRNRKAYRITDHGHTRLCELLIDEDDSTDDERTFAVRLAFCRHLPPTDRFALLQRRRATLVERLTRARQVVPGRDRYARSLVEHRAQSTQRDLEWLDALIAAEASEQETPDDRVSTAVRSEGVNAP